jgi:hypothetical protein
MLLGPHARREDQPIGVHATGRGFLAQIVAHRGMSRKQSEHATFDLPEDQHPARKNLRRDLVVAVEAAKHKSVLGQTEVVARERAVGRFASLTK